MEKKQVYEFLRENRAVFNDVSDYVQDYAETISQEFQLMDYTCEALGRFGFRVGRDMTEIPTALIGA